jgi:hypothetical protein
MASTDSLNPKVWRQSSLKTGWEKEKNMERGWFQVKIAIGFRLPKASLRLGEAKETSRL